MVLFGYDGSDFTHVMDFSGLSFVTHKATEADEGDRWFHENFDEVMTRARDQGVPFLGAYVVPRSGPPGPGEEAQIAIDFVRSHTPWLLDHPGFFWQVDLEHWPYDAVEAGEGDALADELHARTGKPVVIYASHGQYGDSVITDGRPLWNANYNGSGSGDYRQQYQNALNNGTQGWDAYSGQTPEILQYSSDSIFADGNPGDANAFRGTEDDFRARILGGSSPAPTPTPTPPPGGSVADLRILSGVDMDSHGQKMKHVWELLLPADLIGRLYITSAYRAGPPYHGALDDTGALDIAGPVNDQGNRDMRDAAKTLYDRYGDRFLEIIHTTPFADDDGFYVKNGQKYPGGAIYGDEVPKHLDHIHTAAHEGQLDRIISELQAQVPVPAPTPAPEPTPAPVPTPDPTPVPDPAPVEPCDCPDLDDLKVQVKELSEKLSALVDALHAL